MRLLRATSILCALAAVSCAACNRADVLPARADEVARPEDVLDFWTLFRQNCSACHGQNGQNGPALDLANPIYQSLVDDASLKKWITGGMTGTEMPAFGQSAGGFLTEKQVDALVAGMRKNWANGAASAPDEPPYAANLPGDVKSGEQVYNSACVSCHEKPNAQISNPSYLALVADQALRTITIAGRPDLGHPDWQQVRPGQPLTNADVTNVVAYLASLRSATPGQPYPGHP